MSCKGHWAPPLIASLSDAQPRSDCLMETYGDKKPTEVLQNPNVRVSQDWVPPVIVRIRLVTWSLDTALGSPRDPSPLRLPSAAKPFRRSRGASLRDVVAGFLNGSAGPRETAGGWDTDRWMEVESK